MATATEARQALEVVTERAVDEGIRALNSTSGTMPQRRAVLLDQVPSIVMRFSGGTAALAALHYEETRARTINGSYRAELVIPDRRNEWRRDAAWIAEPLSGGDLDVSVERMRDVISLEVAQPYRHTIIGNVVVDDAATGWRRVPNPGACKFCMMLADRGNVYKETTVYFAAHPNCLCGVQPTFRNGTAGAVRPGETVYSPSRTSRTPERRARLREYLNSYYGPDSPTPARG